MKLTPKQRLRLAAWGLAALSALAATVGIRFALSLDSSSPLLWSVCSALGLFAALAAILGGSPSDRLERLSTKLTSLIQSLSTERSPLDGGTPLWGVALICFTINCSIESRHPIDVSTDDQGAFLATARQVHADGGPPALLRQLLSGEFAEANRHPLYLAILSLSPTETFGRAVAFVGGALLLGLAWGWRSRSSPLAAALLAALLATNLGLVRFSTRVVCETWLMVFCAISWLVLTRTPPPDSRAESSSSLFAGAAFGAAWLTKATTGLLFAATIAVRLLDPSPRLRQRLKAIFLMLVAFMAIASPLLIRNQIRFGQPFYNVNSQLLFVDEFVNPQLLAEQRTIGEAAREYLNTHTLFDLLRRELEGLVWEGFILLRALGPISLDDARVLPGFIIACLALIGLPVRWQQARLLLAWTLLSWVIFAWYVPIAAGERFIMPLLFPILGTAATGLVTATRLYLGDDLRARRWLITAGCLWCIAWTSIHLLTQLG